MRFRGVLVKALDAQQDRDDYLIDPAKLEFDPEEVYPIHANFNYSTIAGTCKVHREEDGSITVEGDLSAMFAAPAQLAAGGQVDYYAWSKDRMKFIAGMRLIDIGLTDKHSDLSQPWIEVEPA
jgi:hypothetical protein